MYLLATRGYGFTVEAVCKSCPADLEPYLNAYKLERKTVDEDNWLLGAYIQSAVSTAIEHNLAGRKARSKYIDKPLSQMAEETAGKDVDDMTDEEIDAELRRMIMREDFAQAQLKARGLPEPFVKKNNSKAGIRENG